MRVMNTEPQIVPLPETESPISTEPGTVPPTDSSQPRRNGKIAHLPKEQRALLNQLLDNGVKYETIRDKLAALGVTLNLKNISDWFHGGYQDELQARERRALLRESQERLLDLARHEDAPDLSLVGLQLAVTQLSQQLYELAPGSHKANFQTDTHNYLRMLNTLARMTKALLSLKKYRDESAESDVELQQLNEDRDLSDRECQLLVNKMDRVFKVSRRAKSSSSSIPNRDSSLAPPKLSEGGHSISSVTLSSPTSDCRRRSHESLIDECPGATETRPAIPPPDAPQPPGPAEKPEVSPTTDHQQPAPKSDEGGPSAVGLRQSKTENQKSQIPLELCYDCGAELPPVLPNGQRPLPACRACGARLFPPGTKFDPCQHCGTLQPLLANDERPSPNCRACHNALPPVGHRFVTDCPACGTELPPLTADATRVSNHCPNCRAPAPLLEPVESSSSSSNLAPPPDTAAA